MRLTAARGFAAPYALLALLAAACATTPADDQPSAVAPPSAPADVADQYLADQRINVETMLAVGDGYFNRGDFAAAGVAYADAQEAAADLVSRDAADMKALANLMSAYDRLGRTAKARGDVSAARSYWMEMASAAQGPELGADAPSPERRFQKAVAHSRIAALGGDDSDAQIALTQQLLSDLAAEGQLDAAGLTLLELANDLIKEDYAVAPMGAAAFAALDPSTAFAAGDYDAALQISTQRLLEINSFYIAGAVDAPTAASEHGAQAWRALFAREFTVAEAASRRGLELDPSQIWIATNLAHALMFQDRADEADAIYDAYAARELSTDPPLAWNGVIAEDFAQLRAAGVDHPHMDDVLARLSP